MSVKPEYDYPDKIVIGTRGSPLALVQANMVRDLLDSLGQNIAVEVRVIKTSGDWKPSDGEVRLNADQGGKAQFAKEIEDALLAGDIDIAVHSMKDMEADLPDGLCIPCMLPREDVRDAFLSNIAQNIHDLPMGSSVGTVSLRRQAFLLHQRPDLKVVPFRGNVHTRLEKLDQRQVDATFLACAGMNRLGLSDHIKSVVGVGDMLPAVGQGAIGVEMRQVELGKMSFFDQFCCFKTIFCVDAERGVLRALNGSCHTPVGVYACFSEGDNDAKMRLRAQVVAPDGSQIWGRDEVAVVRDAEQARAFGERVGANLKPDIPDGIL